MKLGDWKWDYPTIFAALLIFGSVGLLCWQSQINDAKRRQTSDDVLSFDMKKIEPPASLGWEPFNGHGAVTP